jgi:hypothetical protein
MNEETEGWAKLHTEKPHNLHSSRKNIRVGKSRKIKWEGHMTRKETRNAFSVPWRNLKKEVHLKDLDIDDKIILLKWI